MPLHGGRRAFSDSERKIILSKTHSKCAHCGKLLDIHTMTVDHVFPVDKGGLNDEYNLLALCEDCNVLKSNFVYAIDDWYNYIDKSEFERFDMYNNYASFEYTNKSLLGYDSLVFYFLSDKVQMMIDNMRRRGASAAKINNIREKAYIRVPLTKAYPGSCEEIYEFWEKMKPMWGKAMLGYDNEYELLNDIEDGCVYVLESNGKVCGIFGFRPVSRCPGVTDFPQVKSTMDLLDLSAEYVMVCAVTDRFAGELYNNVMVFFEDTQLSKGWLPLFFGILDGVYIEKDKCINFPFDVDGKQTTLGFMPVRYIKTSRLEDAENIFKKHGYTNVPEEDLNLWIEYSIRYKYEKEYANDEVAMMFFNKYPHFRKYFKSDSYEYYDVGFVSLGS